jgi:Spy/CpxP family protein refolding chaperone
MKKVILLAVCLFSIATVSKAQEAQRKQNTEKTKHDKLTLEQRAQKHVDGLNAEVTLTEEQKPKVYDLALAKVKKVDEIKAKYKDQPGNKDIAQRELQATKKEFRQNIKAILTPEQLEKFKAKTQEMKTAGKETSLEHD